MQIFNVLRVRDDGVRAATVDEVDVIRRDVVGHSIESLINLLCSKSQSVVMVPRVPNREHRAQGKAQR
eukprot:1777737-Rhodomonas_salina.1